MNPKERCTAPLSRDRDPDVAAVAPTHMRERTILHADLDAFYASVEQLDQPALRGKPVVVGGSPEQRGVVAAASYEARRFGIRSAMPMSRAVRLCGHLVIVPPRFERYGAISRIIMGMFRSVTPLVEPLSLDEAFLDVTALTTDMERAARIARHLKFDVKRRTGLTLSVGVGASKSVAKIASDLEKPDGLVTVPRGTEAAFLAPLPVRALWGVGPRTESLLTGAGIRTIGDLAQRSAASAERLLGQHGAYLHALARGEDDREVATERERKSIGAETTFARDLADGPELREQLHRIATEVGRRMERSGAFASTVAIKLRYANFHTITRQRSVQSPIAGTAEIEDIAKGLLEAVLTPDARVRLIGVQCSRLAIPESTQPPLWSPDDDTDIVPGG